MLAGILGGALDASLLAVLGGSIGHLHALLWATIAYGLAGLLGGLLVGTLAAAWQRVRKGFWPNGRTAALAFAAVFSALALVVVRYRLYRDLFDESIRTLSVKGLLFNGGLVILFAALFVLVRWLLCRPALHLSARMPRILILSGLLLASSGLVSLLTRPAPLHTAVPVGVAPGLEGAPNVILIVVDTLRADRLSCYGYSASRTQNIDALARDGVLYADMTSQASWTKPSFASILTSLYPSSHRAIGKLDRLPQAVTTLAEAMAASGYHTGGIVDNVSISSAFGFEQGFADYTYLSPSYLFAAGESASQLGLYQGLRRVWAKLSGDRIYVSSFYQEASVVNEEAIRWLSSNRHTRFFLFLHYMDPHDPYFAHPYDGRGYARAANQDPDAALAPAFSQLYDSEVRYLDDYLGFLLDWLKSEGLYDETLIALTSDHGEEFQEHGGWWHGQTLFQEQIAVPLIVKYPRGVRSGAVVTDLVTSLDIAPTILDAAGLAVPGSMQGRSLWSATKPPDSVFSEEDLEGNQLYAVRSANLKLVRANADNPRGLPAESLYNLADDPGEQNLLDLTAPEQATAIEWIRVQLRESMAVALEHAVAGESGQLDAAVQQKLRDLGY